MLRYAYGLLYSFPVQLLLLHLRTNFLLLAVWLLLTAMVCGGLGAGLGLQYLFLDPEYLRRSGFFAFVLVGGALGFLTMSWNLTTYLLVGGSFPFLASLSRPFYKYSLNNALLPLAVLLTWCAMLVRFYGGEEALVLAEALTGLLLGLAISLFAYALYFNLTNRDIDYYRRLTGAPPHLAPSPTIGQRGNYGAAGAGAGALGSSENPYGVRTYLGERLQIRPVRSVAHYDSSLLRGIFRQNHLNALLLQFGSIFLLALFGLLGEMPAFQVPAGASFLILFSLFVAIIGAVSYWFSEWRLVLLILLLVGLNYVTRARFFERGTTAYGLNYHVDSLPSYGEERLLSLYQTPTRTRDRAHTQAILENWRVRQPSERPPLVLICASGGGLAAALWTTHVVQSIDACSDGTLLPRTALMTGASGGMLGLGYLRDAYWRQDNYLAKSPDRLARIGSDVLNPTAYSLVSNDLFLPFRTVDYGPHAYPRDRAYAFERSFNELTGGGLNYPLAHYQLAEQRADIPLLFVTPSIVQDGRRMVISPQGVSYMTAPPVAMSGELPLKPDMVDFRWLLEGTSPDSLRLSTALRANASYPYIFPQVKLPTRPAIYLMDAGWRDNYGVAAASRFVHVFRDWINANTSGVVLIQVSAFREEELPPEGSDRRGVIESLVSPVGVAGNILGLQILDQENLLAELANVLGPDRFHLFRFNYQPREADRLRTSVSLHLTDRERRQILAALDEPAVQGEIDRLLGVLGGR